MRQQERGKFYSGTTREGTLRSVTCDVADGSVGMLVLYGGGTRGEGVGQTGAQGNEGDARHACLQPHHTSQQVAQLQPSIVLSISIIITAPL